MLSINFRLIGKRISILLATFMFLSFSLSLPFAYSREDNEELAMNKKEVLILNINSPSRANDFIIVDLSKKRPIFKSVDFKNLAINNYQDVLCNSFEAAYFKKNEWIIKDLLKGKSFKLILDISHDFKYLAILTEENISRNTYNLFVIDLVKQKLILNMVTTAYLNNKAVNNDFCFGGFSDSDKMYYSIGGKIFKYDLLNNNNEYIDEGELVSISRDSKKICLTKSGAKETIIKVLNVEENKSVSFSKISKIHFRQVFWDDASQFIILSAYKEPKLGKMDLYLLDLDTSLIKIACKNIPLGKIVGFH